jgi:hypothetical protein
MNCVPPGKPNNEMGVGGYCESSADCPSAPGQFIVCSNFLETTPRDSWFCTKICMTDADCGVGAYCGQSDIAKGCVPNACGVGPDGGGEAGVDAATDQASEAATEAAPDVAAEGPSEAAADVTVDVAADGAFDAGSDAMVDVSTD